MKRHLLAALALASGITFAETPTATLTSVSYDADQKLLTAAYTMSADGIVTFDILKNGTSIGDTNLWFFSGDINRTVKAGSRSFSWDVGKSCPGFTASAGELSVEVTAWDRLNPPDYLVAELDIASNNFYYASSNAIPGGADAFTYKCDYLVMRKIPAKGVVWRMGSPDTETGHDPTWSQDAVHKVKLLHDYYIGIYPVTMQQFQRALGWHLGPGARHPAWYMARPEAGCSYDALRGTTLGKGWPNADPEIAHAVDSNSNIAYFRKVTGLRLDLPTESEWEYAARAGISTGLNNGEEIAASAVSKNLDKLGRYKYNGGNIEDETKHPDEAYTAIVGSYQPNAWGLYDTHGNVREWCLDYFAAATLDLDNVLEDPCGPSTGASRICRGGSYYDGAYLTRLANRGNASPNTSWYTQGFRLSLVIE